MRRRQFLATLGTASVLGLSGCSQLPFSNPTQSVPTDDQLEYIEYYPHHSESDSVIIVTVDLKSEGGVYIEPRVFGEFQSFGVYTVKPNGSGKQLATLNREDYNPNSDARPQHTFDESTVSNGTILLLLAVRDDGVRYTYGAFTKTQDGSQLRQVAYADSSSQSNNTTETN